MRLFLNNSQPEEVHEIRGTFLQHFRVDSVRPGGRLFSWTFQGLLHITDIEIAVSELSALELVLNLNENTLKLLIT